MNLIREAGWLESSLPVDDEIWMDSADRQGAPWRRYNRLKTRIEAIGGQRLRNATADFRNAFTHRFSPRVETGITNFATRHFDPATGSTYYSFGGTEPLGVKDLTVLLDAELDRCYAAFAAFQALVAEQVAFVTAKNTEMLTEMDAQSAAGRSAADHVETYSVLREADILRDVSSLNWNISSLTGHFDAMVLRQKEDTETLLDESHITSGEAAEEAANLYQRFPEETRTLMSGRLATGIRGLLAKDPDCEVQLEAILPFHALECVQLAAGDARRRLFSLTGFPALDGSGQRPPTNGVVSHGLLSQAAAGKIVSEIFARSSDKANKEDTDRMNQLGLTDRARMAKVKLEKEYGAGLQEFIADRMKEGRLVPSGIEQQIAEKAKTKGWSHKPAHGVSGLPPLLIFWRVCASTAAFVAAEEVGRSAMGRVIQEIANGREPQLRLRDDRDAMLARVLFLALRVSVIRDPDSIPKTFLQEAKRQQATGTTKPWWKEPYAFWKIYNGIREIGDEHGAPFVSDY